MCSAVADLDDDILDALDVLGKDRKMTFQDLVDEAVRDLLKKYGRGIEAQTEAAGDLQTQFAFLPWVCAIPPQLSLGSCRGLLFGSGVHEIGCDTTHSSIVIAVMIPPLNTACHKEWEAEMANALVNITRLEGLKSWKNGKKAPYQGVVKRDWVATGRIDFGTNLNGDDDPDQPSEFRLLVEERRIIESIAGNENLEIQWRAATLKEAKAVVTQYHQYLKENSLIRSIFEPDIFPPDPQDKGSSSAATKARH